MVFAGYERIEMRAERRADVWILATALLLASPAGSCMHDPEPAADLDRPDDVAGSVLVAGQPLLDHTNWRPFERALDPLQTHQPQTIDCDVAGWFVEFGELEVDTGHCNYLLLEHPALIAVPSGSQLELELRHFDLVAPEPASAHVALLFVDAVQWQMQIAVPGPASVLTLQFTTTRALEVGEPIRLHLHNHGQNNWTFAYLRVR
jgi:hypothetical protein